MNNIQTKFRQLLHELFQFDLADLDFGIYRILNHKRRVIERWTEEELPEAIREELRKGALAEQQQAQQALEQARQRVIETLGEDALDAEGNLAKQFHNTKVGQEYLEARQKAAHALPGEALEADVYNHLYTFFSRYYQDGDFISKRRYSKKERYAIPYNGEEVYLYWANHDQYYIKTAEHFTDYTWKAPDGVTVHFKIQEADVEINNVKGEKRFFLPRLDRIAWDEDARTLTIPFEYRPLTEQEAIKYGNQKQQDKIIEEAVEAIPARLKGNATGLAALTAERKKDAKGNSVSYLAHHLRQYTARNTRDFFIHKDLKGFLSRELDFYLKNEVLNLDELEAAGESLAEGWFQLMRLIKRVGNHIIDFLAQIEDFQKALWEKKKFITETFYCITVGNIPEDFYAEIAGNEAQWGEWQELFAVERPAMEDKCIAFLKAHPTLVLDTRHFLPDFTDRLLASFENLDEITDGLLVHGENWQALNLLLENYRREISAIYIDPPYNKGDDEFIYKDQYRHASWISLMDCRLRLGRSFLSEIGTIFVSVDDNEQHHLRSLMDGIFGIENLITTMVWEGGLKNDSRFTSVSQDYIVNYVLDKERLATSGRRWRTRKEGIDEIYRQVEKLKKQYRVDYEAISAALKEWYRHLPKSHPASIHKHYSYVDERGVYFPGDISWPGGGGPRYEVLHPVTGKPVAIPQRGWVFAKQETMQQAIREGRVHFGPDETSVPNLKRYLHETEGQVLPAVFYKDRRAAFKGLRDILGGEGFPNPKDPGIIAKLVEASSDEHSLVLDYFAGSGTTGHAVINLNREDGGRRKFILVEMAEYFDTVLLPRIKKVTFAPEWKEGKPKRMATQEEAARSPRMVKVLRLESYEDALNNITFDEASGQQALGMFGDEYLLRYMLRWESKKSETFLDVEKLQSPFSYKLRIHRDGETREQPVDLPETFAYLIGLEVETRQVLNDGDRRYLVYRGITREGRKAAVIWRETKNWEKADYERDAAFVAELKLTEGADEVFVNGDSYIPDARSLDSLFKAKLFGREA